MNQAKTGRFIAQCRKKKGLTQVRLAEKMGVTNRAVSKWETGKSLPDAALMLPLCECLGITVNELLSGQRLEPDRYSAAAEKNLLTLRQENERQVRLLLDSEIWLTAPGIAACVLLMVTAGVATLPTPARIALIAVALALILAMSATALRIEQKAGYYECRACGCRWVPSYAAVLWAPHMGRMRYLTCPRCGVKSWQRKVITADEPALIASESIRRSRR